MSTENTLMTDAAPTTNDGQATTSQDASQQTTPPATPGEGEQGSTQQATEGQNTEGQKAEGEGTEGDKGEGEAEQKQGAPEKYEFKAPEGAKFDDKVIEQFSEVAKELDLPQDAAQKILDKVGPVLAQRQLEQVEAIRSQWTESAKSDKEFGGQKLDESLAAGKKALDQFGTPELRTLLNESGLGNHPEVIRFFVRTGKAISEDGFVGRSQGNGKAAPKGFNDLANALYPSQQS
jgi:hypothetical protein